MKKHDDAGLLEFKAMMRKMFFTNDVIDKIYSEYDSEKLKTLVEIIQLELKIFKKYLKKVVVVVQMTIYMQSKI